MWISKKYDYDKYNELIKEEDYKNNIKIEYNYDNSGNLLIKIRANLEITATIKTDISIFIYHRINVIQAD